MDVWPSCSKSEATRLQPRHHHRLVFPALPRDKRMSGPAHRGADLHYQNSTICHRPGRPQEPAPDVPSPLRMGLGYGLSSSWLTGQETASCNSRARWDFSHSEIYRFLRPPRRPPLGTEQSAKVDCALSRLPATPCAQVLDIDSDNTVRVWSTLTFAELFRQHDRAQEVDRFLDSLRSCESSTSSRLLILNNDDVDLRATTDDASDQFDNLQKPFSESRGDLDFYPHL